MSSWVVQQEEEDEEEELDEFGAPGPSAPAEAAAAPAALGVAAAVEGTDQWVQCDRCRTWRIVPDAAWCAEGPTAVSHGHSAVQNGQPQPTGTAPGDRLDMSIAPSVQSC